ncbi:unnamed protein product [Plutella xylostella]|uniref:(diamondback moth) hypothetical protein n=1 Tax=Plutella xylostella TaxID=51655 RepID=A0A8S4EA50_PLUXY|nr:unnamed protein product [Plutella xylostella]
MSRCSCARAVVCVCVCLYVVCVAGGASEGPLRVVPAAVLAHRAGVRVRVLSCVCVCVSVVLVRGHFVSYLPLCSRNEPVFVCACCPLAMPETRECVVLGATNVFTTVHAMDMKILHIDSNSEWHLGWERAALHGASWYHLLHPDCCKEAQSKHRLSEYFVYSFVTYCFVTATERLR